MVFSAKVTTEIRAPFNLLGPTTSFRSVCFTPNLYPLHKDNAEIVVVIDVLRATSAICTAFANGVEKVIPVSTVEEALKYKEKGFLQPFAYHV